MTVYSCGIELEDLKEIGLKADVIFPGDRGEYFEKDKCLVTYNEEFNFDGTVYRDNLSMITLTSNDNCIITSHIKYDDYYFLRQDGVNVLIAKWINCELKLLKFI